MNRGLIAGIMLVLMIQSAGALADTVTGVIAEIDFDAREITLNSGATFVVVEDVDIDSLEPGEKVRITFENEDGALIAVRIEEMNTETRRSAGSCPAMKA